MQINVILILTHHMKSRKARAGVSEIGSLDSLILAKFLNQYAETGEKYVDVLQQIIKQNNLKDFDDAKLLSSIEPREFNLILTVNCVPNQRHSHYHLKNNLFFSIKIFFKIYFHKIFLSKFTFWFIPNSLII